MQKQVVATITETQSITLMKKLLHASIGSVSYIRMLFPENKFTTRGMDGVAIKTVNDSLMNQYMDGICEAMEHKYLKTLVFAIYKSNSC
jgi:hypothetical protein